MQAERRTDERIRGEITTEREQLVSALADLRAGIKAKRKPAELVAGAVATGVAALAAIKVIRSFRRD